MLERIKRLERVGVAQRQLVAMAEAKCIELNARILGLRERQDLLMAEIAKAHGRLSQLFVRHLDRATSDLRTAEIDRTCAMAELLRKKRLLEAWQRRVDLMREQQHQNSARDQLAEVIEAALAAALRTSLP
jgi:hypothetical protein